MIAIDPISVSLRTVRPRDHTEGRWAQEVRRSLLYSLFLLGMPVSLFAGERQITRAAHGHVLTNINAWSADSEWLVYDTRSRDDQFTGTTIEQVRVSDGDVRVLYTSKNGAACGVVTAHPSKPEVVFIHGPEHPTVDWTYAMTRRRGVLVDVRQPGVFRALDAATYGPPFVPGALRGGSHVHVFSPDGAWISFTYDDEVLARLGTAASAEFDMNQRNVGVSVPAGKVSVGNAHSRNHDGDWFSVVVTRTVNQPRPGSDEILRACEEGWVGRNGYIRGDGTRQTRALAFQGTVLSKAGTPHAEVFVVDLPEDLTRAGEGPLEGTSQRRPSPPRGTVQRRLTFTDSAPFPGVALAPRHWLRSSPDGSRIAFLRKDAQGVVQLWTISPNGGQPQQITRNAQSVASALSWSSDSRWIAHVMDGSVCVTDVAAGETRRLTPKTENAEDAPKPFACVVSPDDAYIAYTRSVGGQTGRYDQIFVVPTR